MVGLEKFIGFGSGQVNNGWTGKVILGLGPGQVDNVSGWKSILGLGPGQVDNVSGWRSIFGLGPGQVGNVLEFYSRSWVLLLVGTAIGWGGEELRPRGPCSYCK